MKQVKSKPVNLTPSLKKKSMKTKNANGSKASLKNLEKKITQSPPQKENTKNKTNKPPFNPNQKNKANKSPNQINEPNKKAPGMKRKALLSSSEKSKKPKVEDTPEKINRTIFVGNVPVATTSEEIRNVFETYGKIENIKFRGVPKEKPNLSKRLSFIKKQFDFKKKSMLCYITFVAEEDAVKALAANGTVFKEFVLRVNRADDRTPFDASKSIFVGHVPLDSEEDDVRKLFEDCGIISSIRIPRDNVTNIGRGFCFVNFESDDAVELALQMENVKLKGQQLRISRNNHSEKNAPTTTTNTTKTLGTGQAKSIIVQYFPPTTKNKDILNIFKRYGFIENIAFATAPLSKGNKSCTIAFSSAEAVDKVMAKKYFTYKNRTLTIRRDNFDTSKFVFVTKVPTDATVASVTEVFKCFGNIKSIKLLNKPKPPQTMGIAFVEFRSSKSATNAIKKGTIMLEEAELTVQIYGKREDMIEKKIKNETKNAKNKTDEEDNEDSENDDDEKNNEGDDDEDVREDAADDDEDDDDDDDDE